LSRLTLLFDAAAIQTDGPAVNRGFHAEENDLGGLGELSVDPNAAASARGRFSSMCVHDQADAVFYQFPHDVTLGAIRPLPGRPAVLGASPSCPTSTKVRNSCALSGGRCAVQFTGSSTCGCGSG